MKQSKRYQRILRRPEVELGRGELALMIVADVATLFPRSEVAAEVERRLAGIERTYAICAELGLPLSIEERHLTDAMVPCRRCQTLSPHWLCKRCHKAQAASLA